MTALIEVNSLSKRFGPLVAVDDISFTVDRGEVLGFLGPNGAGKSTTMRMIMGFVTPDSGAVRVCGHDVAEAPTEARARIGYLPEGAPLYADMTAAEFLRFTAGVRALSGARRAERIDWAVAQLGLQPVLPQPIETLSKGYKRRVGLAQAVVHDPDVLILDEPTDGLDPNQKHEVRGLIREMARKKAIIISTHLLEEVEAVCSRAMIINRGRVVTDCTPDELAARSRHRNAVTVRVKAVAIEDLRTSLAMVAGVATVETRADAGRCIAFATDGRPIIGDISRHLQEKGWQIDELHVDSGRLDDVFRAMTAADGAGPRR